MAVDGSSEREARRPRRHTVLGQVRCIQNGKGIVAELRGRANGLQSFPEVPRKLWHMVALARHRLLMLDYDGTLAPLQVAREAAYPLPRSSRTLKAIARNPHTRVAVVSGRPVSEIDRLLGPIRATIVGEHGWEMRFPDGEVIRRAPPPSAAEALDQAERKAGSRGWRNRLERKRCSVVLHTRGRPDDEARGIEEACAALWQPFCDRAPMVLDRISGGLELRTRGRDKGTVVLSLLSHEPPGTVAVFVGDDASDEDAFRAVREFGFGVRVGTCARPSLAAGKLPSCDAVADFLEFWRGLAGPAAGG